MFNPLGFELVRSFSLPISFHILYWNKINRENFCLLLLFRHCFTVLMGRLIFGVCVCVRASGKENPYFHQNMRGSPRCEERNQTRMNRQREDDIGGKHLNGRITSQSIENNRILENRMVRGEQLPFLMCRRTTFFDWRQKNVAVVVAVVVIFWQVLKHINDLIYTIQNSNRRIKTKLEKTHTHTCASAYFYVRYVYMVCLNEYAFLFVRDIFCALFFALSHTRRRTHSFLMNVHMFPITMSKWTLRKFH